MGSLSIFHDEVLLLLMGLAALTLVWWGSALWWTVRRTDWRYGALVMVVSALSMLAVAIALAAIFGDSFWPIAVAWALLPPGCAWGAIKFAGRRGGAEKQG